MDRITKEIVCTAAALWTLVAIALAAYLSGINGAINPALGLGVIALIVTHGAITDYIDMKRHPERRLRRH